MFSGIPAVNVMPMELTEFPQIRMNQGVELLKESKLADLGEIFVLY